MITVEHLTKRYGEVTAVDDISFTLGEGHIYGFLGPNGAGKSTTMNIMTGCLAATAGEVKIDGLDIFEDARAAKQRIGYLPEIPPLYTDETPEEYLRFVAEAKGVARRDIPGEIARVLEETRLTDMAGRLIRNLSKGYRQRVGIAQALLGNPPYIILDEPTVGLDPLQIIEIRDLIRELGKKHTVILSSHILSEVQAICESVLIIAHGKLVAFDTPENLEKTLAANNRLTIEADGDEAAVRAVLDGLDAVGSYTVETPAAPETEPAAPARTRADLTLAGEADAAARAVFLAFAAADLPLLQMTPIRADLENIFIELTEAESAAPEPPAAAVPSVPAEQPAEPEQAEQEEADHESSV